MKNKLYLHLAASFSLLLVAFLGYVVKFYSNWLVPFDNLITTGVRSIYPVATNFFLWVTRFGDAITIIILLLAFLVLLVRGKKYAEALWLTSNLVIISGVINPLLKLFFARERPSLEHLVHETSNSFPSGHAVTSIVFYGTLVVLIPMLLQNKSLARILQGVLIFLILAIGISRIYLGVHYPSDILGGYALGLTWLFFTYPYFVEKRFVWRFQKKQR